MADKVVALQIQANAAEAQKTVGNLKQELRQAQREATAISAAFGTTSQEAIQAAKRVAELKDTIQDAKETVDLFDPGQRFAAFGNALRTVAGGFTAATGALALFGVQSEEVEKTLLRVQGALALTEGLNTIVDAGQAFDKLKIAITGSAVAQKTLAVSTNLTTGAFRLLGVQVTATSTAFAVLRGAIIATGIGALVVGLSFAISKLVEFASSSEDAADSQEKLAEATRRANEAFEDQVAFLDRSNKLNVLRAKAAGASEAEITNLERKAIQDRISFRNQEINDRIRKGEDTKALLQANLADQQALQEFDLNQQIKIREANIASAKKERDEIIRLRKEQAEQLKKNREDLRKAQNDLNSASSEGVTEESDGFLAQAKKEQEEFEQSQRDAAALRISLQEKVAAEEDRIRKERLDKEKKDLEERRKLEEQKVQIISGALGTVADAVGRQTVAGKALAVAQATIDGFLAVQKALASAPPPFNFIAAAAVGAATIANIRNIVRTQIPGQGGGGGNIPNGATQAPVNPLPTLTRTQLDQQAVNQRGNAAVRAYVVETDITGQQALVRKLNRQARLG